MSSQPAPLPPAIGRGTDTNSDADKSQRLPSSQTTVTGRGDASSDAEPSQRLTQLEQTLARLRKRRYFAWHLLPLLLLCGVWVANPLIRLFLWVENDVWLAFIFTGQYLRQVVAVELSLVVPFVLLMLIWRQASQECEVKLRLAQEKKGQSGQDPVGSLRTKSTELRNRASKLYAHDETKRNDFNADLGSVDSAVANASPSARAVASAQCKLEELNSQLIADELKTKALPSAASRKLLSIVGNLLALTMLFTCVAWFGKADGDIFRTSWELPIVRVPLTVVIWSWIASFIAIIAPSSHTNADKVPEMSPAAQLARILKGVLIASVVYVGLRQGGTLLFTVQSSVTNTSAATMTIEVRDYVIILSAILAGFYDRVWSEILAKFSKVYLATTVSTGQDERRSSLRSRDAAPPSPIG